jgi:hypothetical protein
VCKKAATTEFCIPRYLRHLLGSEAFLFHAA